MSWLQADGFQWLTKQPKSCLTGGRRVAPLAFAQCEAVRDWTRVHFSDEYSFVLLCQKSKGWCLPGELKLRFTVKHPQRHNAHACFGYGG